MYLKNDTSPKPIYAILVNASDGSPITTGVSAYHIQGTTRTAGAGTLTHIANGRWAYTPTQAETNYDAFAIDFYHASAVGQGALVEVITADQGIALITADTSAIKAKTDAYLDATVSSRLAASAYTAPDNANISAIKSTVDANLDAPVSSRAPASTALSNLTWTDAKAGYLDAAISSRLAGSAYTAPDNANIAAIKATVDTNLDAAVSSRLAAASYTAPDNASIAAIKAQTDKLTFDASNNVYATGLGGGGSVQVVVQPLDVGPIAYTPDGGTIEVFTYSRILASWLVRDTDLVGHDLRFIVFSQSDPATKKAESAGGEITITMQDTHSLVSLNAAERALPAGPYGWVLRDQTVDTVLLRGKLFVKAAPDAD